MIIYYCTVKFSTPTFHRFTNIICTADNPKQAMDKLHHRLELSSFKEVEIKVRPLAEVLHENAYGTMITHSHEVKRG